MTLVEVMVSLSLIVLVGGGIIGLLIENTKTGVTMDRNYVAVNIAKNRIDRLRELKKNTGYSYLNTANETNVIVNRSGLPDEGGDFERTTVVIPNFEGNANLTEAIVTVKYKGTGGASSPAIVLTTLMSSVGGWSPVFPPPPPTTVPSGN
jgi:type II secretory pathway pseudopilin PulG